MPDLDITVRTACIDDLSSVDALLARSYPNLLKADYPPAILIAALPMISRAQPDLMQSGSYYLAELGEKVVAAGGWTPDPTRRELGHIRHLVSDDRYQRQGLARAVMVHTLAAAKTSGMREMECWSTLTGVEFYKAMGFASEGPMQLELAPKLSFPAIRMRLAL